MTFAINTRWDTFRTTRPSPAPIAWFEPWRRVRARRSSSCVRGPVTPPRTSNDGSGFATAVEADSEVDPVGTRHQRRCHARLLRIRDDRHVEVPERGNPAARDSADHAGGAGSFD